MAEELKIRTERVDDIPLLVKMLQNMGIRELIDKHLPMHGNWKGASLGVLAVIWLTCILSQGDHCKSHVQPWAEQREKILKKITGWEWTSNDLNDDRLGGLLRYLAQDEPWEELESDLDRRTIRVYALDKEAVRLDSTTANGYWEVTEDGLFQYGHSKDHRPDLPQIKVMVSTLDPFGMPLVTTVLPGHRADDPLYIPSIQRVQKSLQRRGLLYVGDCKMSAQATRAFIQQSGDFYLCPLSLVQFPQQEIIDALKPVLTGEQPVSEVKRPNEQGKEEVIAKGYEQTAAMTAEWNGKTVRWTERRLLVCSLAQAKSQENKLQKKLQKVQEEILALNERKQGKKRYQEVKELQERVEGIVKNNQVDGLFQISYEEKVTIRKKRVYRDCPEREEEERTVTVKIERDEEKIKQAVEQLGWRVYVTNAPVEQVSLKDAVLRYRASQPMEGGFGRLKNFPLSLLPSYLEREDHVKGLVHLLSIGLRVLTLTEFVVRRALEKTKEKLSGLYPGNPKRSTARPSAELLLRAFDGLTLTILTEETGERTHLTPLSPLHLKIMALLGLPDDLYHSLGYG